jgi:hypothetical protein
MSYQPSGPRRARSLDAYLRQTRLIALFAVLALVAGIVSDFTNEKFWERHSLLSGLASSMILVILTGAVINEVLEQRRRQRWSILAQFVMFELVRNARMTWMGVLDVAGLLPPDDGSPDFLEAAREVVRDNARLTPAVRSVLDDKEKRDRLHDEVAFLADHADGVISRWAGIMLNVEVYAEIIDRHVELAGDITWIGALLDGTYPPDDFRRQRRARSSPARQIEGNRSDSWMADRIVVIVQLAESLDRGTLDIAVQVVPVEWWEGRLRTTAQAEPGSHSAS